MLRRAVRLAMRGRGAVEPNPMVGCVLERDGLVVAEGFHAAFGQAHAEPSALDAAGAAARGATAFVTLEPCCHVEKKTPPCVPSLIAAGVRRVVVGCLDPNPQVNGRGVAMLRDAGVEVVAPRLEEECRQLIAPFIARTLHARPYVTLKWAQSSNGQIAGARGRRVRISGDAADRQVHRLRGRCDAIAVGTNTVLADDPLLTARGVPDARRPVRVILSNGLNIPPGRRLIETARQFATLVYCAASAAEARPDLVAVLRGAGVEVVPLPPRDLGRFSFDDALRDLAARGASHVLVEPGPTLAHALIARGQADRAWVIHSPRAIEDAAGFAASRAPDMPWPSTGHVNLRGDVLVEHLNPSSPVTFAAMPSADLVLAGADAENAAT